jgi:hypothetical protein
MYIGIYSALDTKKSKKVVSETNVEKQVTNCKNDLLFLTHQDQESDESDEGEWAITVNIKQEKKLKKAEQQKCNELSKSIYGTGIEPVLDELNENYYGKRTFDGLLLNCDSNGNCVGALRDQYGHAFANELENMQSSCYDCGRPFGCCC